MQGHKEVVRMKTDQVERLTREKGSIQPIRPRDVREILDEIIVRSPAPPKSVKDYITQEPEDPTPPGEGVFLQAVLTGLSWTMFPLALGALAWLTLSAGEMYLRHP